MAQVNVNYLTEDQLAQLRKVAAEKVMQTGERWSASSVARQAVIEYLERHQDKGE